MKLLKVGMRWLLLLLVVLQITGLTLTSHTHITRFGIITHSHPSKQKKHTHTANEFVFIQNHNKILTTCDIVPHFDTENKNNLFTKLVSDFVSQSAQQISLNYKSLRAPPFSLV